MPLQTNYHVQLTIIIFKWGGQALLITRKITALKLGLAEEIFSVKIFVFALTPVDLLWGDSCMLYRGY